MDAHDQGNRRVFTKVGGLLLASAVGGIVGSWISLSFLRSQWMPNPRQPETSNWISREGKGAIWGQLIQGMGKDVGAPIRKGVIRVVDPRVMTTNDRGLFDTGGIDADANGYFFSGPLPPGRYHVLVAGDLFHGTGWCPAAVPDVTVHAGDVISLGSIRLLLPARIVGRTVGVDGRPLDQVFVEIESSSDGEHDYSDSQGFFKIDNLLAPATYPLLFNAAGAQGEEAGFSAAKEVTVGPGVTKNLGDVVLKPR